ncbi:MAG: sigma-70 family RNA polymerase sigma factor [Ruminococcus sp.]|nr:sigma-70 family RNA polymerase sigma factor [Ruminococcus sp.]
MSSKDKTFERIYNETKMSALKYISSKCLKITDIEDIYQETYLRVGEALDKGTEPKNSEAFVIGIARHCLSHYYSAAQRLRARISLSSGSVSDEPVDLEDDTDIESLAADKALYDEIFREITARPSDVQRMFYLHYFLDLTLSETAELMGITESRVRQRLYQTIRQLRRKYRGR